MAQVQITPDSVITLYDNVECMDGEQVIFTSREAQTAYFSKRAVGTFTGCTYVRQTGRVRVPMRLNAAAFSANYIGYINPSMENVRVYGRIIDTEYTNNETTEIQFQIDWFQTFMFGANYKSTTIEREMLSDVDYAKATANPYDRSILELNTEEGIEVNDYDRVRTVKMLTLPSQQSSTFIPHIYVCVLLSAVNFVPSKDLQTVVSRYGLHHSYKDGVEEFIWDNGLSNGIVTPAALLCARPEVTFPATEFSDNKLASNYDGDIPLYQALIDVLTFNKVSSSIISIFQLTDEDCKLMFSDGEDNEVALHPVENKIGGPKAQRYPFACARIITSDNTDKVLKYENFSGSPILQMGIDVYNDSEKWIAPVDYCSHGINYSERLSYSGLPQLAYVTDSYLEYAGGLWQKAASKVSDPTTYAREIAEAIKGLVKTGLDAASGNIGAASSELVNTASKAAEAVVDPVLDYATFKGDNPVDAIKYMSRRVANAGGTYHAGQSHAIGYAFLKDKFRVEYDTLTEAAQARVAAFFNAYGYTSGRLGKPRVTAYMGRSSEAQPHWVTIDGVPSTYCKTSTLRVYGLNKPACDYIAAIFNAGCRFIKGDGR